MLVRFGVVGLSAVVAGCGADGAGPRSAAPATELSGPRNAALTTCSEPPFANQPADGIEPPAGQAEIVRPLVDAHSEQFTGVWWDRAEGKWVVTVAEETGVARELVASALPAGTAFRVVSVGVSQATLSSLQERVTPALSAAHVADATSIRVWDGRLEVMLRVLDAASMKAVADLAGNDVGLVCVTGADPADVPPAGPQADHGDGWRLLGDQIDVGGSYVTHVATTSDEYGALWRSLGLAGEPPAVDFGREIVVHFGAVFGSSCPEIRLDRVVIDTDAHLVYADIVRLGGYRVCTGDARPRAYVVAIDRGRLPQVPFRVQLSATVTCKGCKGSEVTEVAHL